MTLPAFKFSDEDIKELGKIAAYLTSDQIAEYYCIARSTLYLALERQPEAKRAISRGKIKTGVQVAKNLLQQSNEGNTTATIFYLRTRCKWKEPKQDVAEVDANASKDDKQIIINIVDAKKPE